MHSQPTRSVRPQPERTQRRDAIVRAVRGARVHSQAELQELLVRQGFDVNQATLSRDLRDMRLRKGPDGYELPSEPPAAAGGSAAPAAPALALWNAVREWMQSVTPTGQLFVLRTPPSGPHRSPRPSTNPATRGCSARSPGTTRCSASARRPPRRGASRSTCCPCASSSSARAPHEARRDPRASGYTGKELVRLLRRHRTLELACVMGGRADRPKEPPALPVDLDVAPLDLDRLAGIDGVFLCTPHGASALLARECLQRGAKVVDLSADFRLRSEAAWEEAYGHPHAAPELIAEAVYGLTEHARARVAAARLVANPGCYPTSILLPLLPLLRARLVDTAAGIIADSKSGVSGAGKVATERTHYGNVHDNFLAYGVGTHRHAPEIWQEAGTDSITFVPHLLPLFRGILSTIYATPARGASASDLRHCLAEAYAGEPFVRVFDRGLPELNRVQMTNECHVAVADGGGKAVIVSAIDNLTKGASGQALQNMNLMLGCDEAEGLA
jgi:N-acetyl-gamma-glutamyl-phosphate reductase